MPSPVTGASSGFGCILTEIALSNGDNVVATARTPSNAPSLSTLSAAYPDSRLLVLKLDVTQPAQIPEAFTAALAHFGRVDVVFNNAGWVPLGETEAHPEEDARKMFDTNFWGCANVSREAVRFFRDENKPSGGVLLVNSSMSGLRSVPVMAYYSASKHGRFTISLSPPQA